MTCSHVKDIANVMHTDDTPVDALEPGTGGKHTGRFWLYVGDPQRPYCLFDYTASRSRYYRRDESTITTCRICCTSVRGVISRLQRRLVRED